MFLTAAAPSTLPKANEPCWCGSGRKYKRCHKKSEGRVTQGIVTPIRAVPADIPRPPYADSGQVTRRPEPPVKAPDVIERMRRAGAVAAEVLLLVGEEVSPPRRDHCLAFGVDTEIDNSLDAEGILRAIRSAGIWGHAFQKTGVRYGNSRL